MLARFLRYFAVGLLDIFYPRNCLITGTPIDGEKFRFICRAGIQKLAFIVERSACRKCGVPAMVGRNFSDGICSTCRDCVDELQFGRSRSVVVLDAASRPLVYSLKYWKHPAVARDMAFLGETFSDFLAGAVLVPVPLYKKRFRWRGYNQSKILAQAFAKTAPETRVETLLVRTRDTGTQTRLDAAKRRQNVKDAFAVSPRAKIDPFARYVLVDDVFTTGSTLSECARALRAAGAINIDAVTFAHG